MNELTTAITGLPARMMIALVRIYQWTISPLLGPSCRFYPSCSAYACSCLRDHGLLRGGWLTVRRLGRCHPWHPGGVDMPPGSRRLDGHHDGDATAGGSA